MANNRSKHAKGRAVWTEYRNQPSNDLGTFLRGTKTDAKGHPIHELMRAARPGDLVVHFLREEGETYIAGCSRVAKRWTTQVLNKREMYRIELRNFADFREYRLLLEDFIKANSADIKADMQSFKNEKPPHYYPFALANSQRAKFSYIKKAILAKRLGG